MNHVTGDAAVPNRSSLIRRLAELRHGYTGETDSSVIPAISHGARELTTEDRAGLLTALGRDYSTRLLGEDSGTPLPPQVRNAVLPDTSSTGQRELEAGVLAAASRAVSHLTQCPVTRPTGVFRMVRPLPTELVLHVEPTALAPLLLELLPRPVDGGVTGVPGLRVRLHRRHLELYLIDTVDTDEAATVLLANVSYRQWTAALAFITEACPDAPDMRWSDSEPDSLTWIERAAIATGHRAPGPVALTSALLRRFLVFGRSTCPTIRIDPWGLVDLGWSAGPSAATVASRLVHPITGLHGDRFRVTPHAGYVSLTSADGHPRTEPPTLILRPATQNHARPDNRSQPDTATAWARWDEVINAPNPIHA
jgi:hypothetical protein